MSTFALGRPGRPPEEPGMSDDRLNQALQLVVAAAFLLIGLLALRDWLRGGERRRGYLALALGSLGLVAMAGGLESLVGNRRISPGCCWCSSCSPRRGCCCTGTRCFGCRRR